MMNTQASRILQIMIVVVFLSAFSATNLYALSDGHATCDYCHALHGGPGNNLLNQPNQSDHVLLVEVVCSNCHDAVDPPITTAPQVVSHNFDRGNDDWRYISCRECHDPHDNQNNAGGGTNLKMVGFKKDSADPSSGFATAKIRRIDADGSPNTSHTDPNYITDVYYENAGPTTWDYAKGSNDNQICEVCHSDRSFSFHHGRSPGDDCQECHKHSSGFDRPWGSGWP